MTLLNILLLSFLTIPFIYIGLFKLFKRLAVDLDCFSRLYVKTFYWLTEKLDLTIVRTKSRSKPRDLSTSDNRYHNISYVLMELDQPRKRAYEQAAQYACIPSPEKQDSNTVVWLDIGTGPHLFLTQIILKSPITENVHAVETDPKAYQQAKTLQESSFDLRQKVTLHKGYSGSIDWKQCCPPPNAIIHDVLGTVSTEEGCLTTLRHTMARFKHVSLCIPHEFGTYCIPVSYPRISWLSSIFSKLFGGPSNITRKRGVQCVFNPPKNVHLCKKAEFIEKFDSLNIPLDNYFVKTVQFTVETEYEAEFTGFYLAPYLLTAKNLENGLGVIDGLSQNTNWGVKYACMLDKSQKNRVKQGDQITVGFQTNLNSGCPIYRLEAWINNSYISTIDF